MLYLKRLDNSLLKRTSPSPSSIGAKKVRTASFKVGIFPLGEHGWGFAAPAAALS